MRTRYILAAGAAFFMLWNCGKENETAVDAGRKTLRAGFESEESRVSFNDIEGKFSWNTDDRIAVHVGDAFVRDIPIDIPETGDFTVEEHEGSLRNFYAVYPSEAAVESTTLQVTLPTSYDISGIIAGGDASDAYRRTSDYSPVPMVAENDPDHDLLYFRMVGGLLRIHCGAVPAGVTKARVTFDKDVTGTYDVNVSNPRDPKITTRGSLSNNTVDFILSDTGLAEGTDFVLNVPVPCGEYGTVRVMLGGDAPGLPVSQVYDDFPLEFLRRHGKSLLFGHLDFNFAIGGLEDVVTEYTGGSKNLAEFFYSYKTDGVNREAVPFIIQFSEDGVTDWTTTPPDWLTLDSHVNYLGTTTSEVIGISLMAQENSAVDTHAEILKARPEVTTRQDLSLINVATGEAVSRSTANSYVVQAPGLYRIPAVYGNALKDGVTNRNAFQSKDEDGNWRSNDEEWTWRVPDFPDYPVTLQHAYYGYFKDHTNGDITTPWIKDQHPTGTLTAKLLWTDSDGLVSDVSLTAEKDFIDFSVPAETICQGNALVALLIDGVIAWSWHIWVTDADLVVKSDGSSDGPNGYRFAPLNLGWCDAKDLQRYAERTIKVRAVQKVDDGATSDVVTVTTKAGLSIIKGGSGYLYQWGRKDPQIPAYRRTEITANSSSTTIVEKEVFPTEDAFRPGARFDAWKPIGEVIQHPYWRYYYTGSYTHGWNWFDQLVYNIWDSNYNESTRDQWNVPVKTVYDPCPVGYQVPSPKAFEGFQDSNFPVYTLDGVHGRLYNGNVFFPFAGSRGGVDEFSFGAANYATVTKELKSSMDVYKAMFFQFNDAVIRSDLVYLQTAILLRPVQER